VLAGGARTGNEKPQSLQSRRQKRGHPKAKGYGKKVVENAWKNPGRPEEALAIMREIKRGNCRENGKKGIVDKVGFSFALRQNHRHAPEIKEGEKKKRAQRDFRSIPNFTPLKSIVLTRDVHLLRA